MTMLILSSVQSSIKIGMMKSVSRSLLTGFDDFYEKKESLGNVTHLGGYRREDLSTPNFHASGKNKQPC